MTEQLEVEDAASAEEQIPDWVNETPDDYAYDLTMYEGGGSVSGQDISLTRDEFVALKQHLAVMRGYLEDNNQ